MRPLLITNVILIVSFISFNLKKGNTQNYSEIYFEEEHKVPFNTVYSIQSDSKGFTWFGTSNGIYKFDGNNFQSYNSNSIIPEREIIGVSINSSDHVMLHSLGLDPFVIYKNKIISTNSTTEIPNSSRVPIFKTIDKTFINSGIGDNKIFLTKFSIGEISSLDTINLGNRSITNIESFDTLITVYSKDPNGNYYLETFNETKLIHSLKLGKSNQSDNSLFTNSNRNTLGIFFKSHLFLYKFDSGGKAIQVDSIKSQKKFNRVFLTNSGDIFFAENSGGISLYRNGKYKKTYCKNLLINCLHEDSKGNLWIGTYNNGFIYLINNSVDNYTFSNSIGSNNITSIGSFGNNIILGFDNLGIAKFKDGQHSSLVRLGSQHLKYSRILELVKINDDILIIGSDKGLFEYNNISKTTRQINSSFIKTLDNIESTLFIGTETNLIEYELNTHNQHELVLSRIKDVHVDKNNTLWASNAELLWSKRFGENEMSNFTKLGKNIHINDIQSMNDLLILSTNSGIGLIKDTIINFTREEHGLLDNNCGKLTINNNCIWIATNKGLNKISLSPTYEIENIKNFGVAQGLISNSINEIYLRNDTIWAATNKGLSVFTEKNIKKPLKPKLFQVSGVDTIYEIGQNVNLPSKNNKIVFQYSNEKLGFTQDYLFRLLPNEDWERTSENIIKYFQLSAGNYTFQIKTLGIDKDNNSEVLEYSFKVLPRFYQSWSFRIRMILLGLVSIIIAWKYRIQLIRNKEHKELEFEKNMAKLELEAIKAQIKPHFIYNCLSSIKNTVVQERTRDAEQQISTFSRLIRQTLDFSKLDFVNLNQEINYLNNYLQMEKLRFKEKLKYTIKVDRELNKEFVFIPCMLLQPILENAINHGLDLNKNKSDVILEFNVERNNLVAKVEDFGIGLRKSTYYKESLKPSGYRMILGRIKTFNKIFNYNIKIDVINKSKYNFKSQGTLVVINFGELINYHENRNNR